MIKRTENVLKEFYVGDAAAQKNQNILQFLCCQYQKTFINSVLEGWLAVFFKSQEIINVYILVCWMVVVAEYQSCDQHFLTDTRDLVSSLCELSFVILCEHQPNKYFN